MEPPIYSLIATPNDKSLYTDYFCPESLKDKKFRMKVPVYTWNLSKMSNIDEKVFVPFLINIYLKYCNTEEHKKLLSREHYLRFILHQDSPDESPYVYGYLRDIKTLKYELHLEIIGNCPSDRVAVEVNYATFGVFYYVSCGALDKNNIIKFDDIIVAD